MLLLKFLGFMLIGLGALLSYGAKTFVIKYQLDKYAKCSFEEELSETELREYKFNKALVNLKTYGLLVMLPGMIFVYYAFK